MEVTLYNEDHTLGYLLQQFLLKDPDVMYAGYINPHPSEETIVLKIELKDESQDPKIVLQRAIKTIKECLNDLRIEYKNAFNN